MPCNSDHLEASLHERAATAIFQLLDELDGKPLDPGRFGNGYDERAYNRRVDLDQLTKKLCDRLQVADVSKFSLEMQMWWRNHQIADAARIQKERDDEERGKMAKKALSKLTKEERELLGLPGG